MSENVENPAHTCAQILSHRHGCSSGGKKSVWPNTMLLHAPMKYSYYTVSNYSYIFTCTDHSHTHIYKYTYIHEDDSLFIRHLANKYVIKINAFQPWPFLSTHTHTHTHTHTYTQLYMYRVYMEVSGHWTTRNVALHTIYIHPHTWLDMMKAMTAFGLCSGLVCVCL